MQESGKENFRNDPFKSGNIGDFESKFFIEIPNIDKLDIKSPILILGLNPSHLGDRDRNLFWYIPEIEGLNESSKKLHLQAKKFTYERYFKTCIELFKRLNYDPIWYNKSVLQGIFDNNKEVENLNEDLKNHLMNYFRENVNGQYLLFADLIPYTKTNSKEIIQFLEEKEENKVIIDLVNNYVKTLLKYLKPKLVLAANASVSNYLLKYFTDSETDSLNETDCTYIDNKKTCGTRIFLASMLTNGVMDTFSRKRLFNEMQDFISYG